MKRIVVDMDEVIADSIAQYLKWYERDFGIQIDLKQLHNKKLEEVVPPEHKQVVANYPNTRGFFKDLAVIKNSQEVLKEINRNYELFIVSAAMEFKFSLEEKYEWLEKHFGFIGWKNWVFCGNKSIVSADIMIDDNEFNLKDFQGRRMVFTAPHNLHYTAYERINDWESAGKLLL